MMVLVMGQARAAWWSVVTAGKLIKSVPARCQACCMHRTGDRILGDNVYSGTISVQPITVSSVVIIGSKYTAATLPPNVGIHRCEDV